MALLPFSGAPSSSLKIGSTISGGTSGEVLYVDGSGKLGQTATVLNSSGQLSIAAGQALVIAPAATSQPTGLSSPSLGSGDAALAFRPTSGSGIRLAIQFMPKGDAVGAGAFANSQMTFFNTDFVADGTNYEGLAVAARGSLGYFITGAAGGTGSLRSFTFSAQSGSSAQLTIDANGNTIIGSASLATNATTGFFYIPTCSGAPTGTPTSYSGRNAMVYDTFNHKLWFYDTGTSAWRGAFFS